MTDPKSDAEHFIHRLATIEATTPIEAAAAIEGRSRDEVLLSTVELFFGEPIPQLPSASDILNPAVKARYTAELLLYYARAYERGDEQQQRLAEASINRYWIVEEDRPHVRFTRYVFELAPLCRNANTSVAGVVQQLIRIFKSQYRDIAEKMDPELVQEALECALIDGRKNRLGKNKWKAIADAWNSTGDNKRPGTFKTDWNEEKAKDRKLRGVCVDR